MKIINGSEITMVRGDSLSIKVTVYDNEKTRHEYVFRSGDVVRFAVKRNYGEDEQCVIVKEIPIDTMMLVLEPQDTKDLQYDTYVYEIELDAQDGRIDTFIDNGILRLKPEVYVNGTT